MGSNTMKYNTVDVNEYVKMLNKITGIDIKTVFVIVYKNFNKLSSGEISTSDAYLNISNELTMLTTKEDEQSLVPRSA